MRTTNDLFQFNGQQLRSVIIDGEPWFVAQDACRILGIVNTYVGIMNLDADEKRTMGRAELSRVRLQSRCPRLSMISRPGLFKLIQRSNKPEAKEFDRWVRHEVLPQIMDSGGYMTPLQPPFRYRLQSQAC